ncbi:MAG: PAS domain [Candidatus Methanohalarchaeum thermophilum]|uniref:histidine kinase n=1 Tax=Methanohalarchaeum thermophilum TaxID=1903181 RepID=A0A1Q6DT43_METT1|nr:MAG: PAS domain [Candidatus Methanohalarchaeum thermophilum]
MPLYECKYDEKWTMKYICGHFQDVTGYDPSALLNNNKISYRDIIHPSDRSKVKNKIKKSIKQKRPFNVVYRIKTANNKIKKVWEEGHAVYREDGPELLEGIILDIESEEDVRDNNTPFKGNMFISKDVENNEVILRYMKEVKLDPDDALKLVEKIERENNIHNEEDEEWIKKLKKYAKDLNGTIKIN